MVPKNTGDWRPRGGYTALNKATVPDRYSIPHILDIGGPVKSSTIYSKVNLVTAHHQILIEPADIPKTAIVKPFVALEFLQTPVVLRSAP